MTYSLTLSVSTSQRYGQTVIVGLERSASLHHLNASIMEVTISAVGYHVHISNTS